MTSTITSSSQVEMASVSTDQWIAFNEEMAALVRAGIPLEAGLPALSREMPRNLRSLVEVVSARLVSGEPIEQVLAAPNLRWPPAYRAVVAAGVRSGNLAAALESITATARKSAELRRVTLTALAYPLFVLVLGYILIKFAVTKLLPAAAAMYVAENFRGKEIVLWLADLGQTPLWRSNVPLLVLAAVLAIVWFRSSRAGSGVTAGLSWLPTFGRMIRCGRVASFAEVLALLVEHRTPLVEAIPLAAEASGDKAIVKGAKVLTERIARGEAAGDLPRGFPPFVGWLLGGATVIGDGSSTRLPMLLRQAAVAERAKANRIGKWLSVYLPLILTAAVGALALATLALLIFGPWLGLVYQIDRM